MRVNNDGKFIIIRQGRGAAEIRETENMRRSTLLLLLLLLREREHGEREKSPLWLGVVDGEHRIARHFSTTHVPLQQIPM